MIRHKVTKLLRVVGRKNDRFTVAKTSRSRCLEDVKEYSPSICHQAVMGNTETTLSYNVGDVVSWQNSARDKLRQLVRWQDLPAGPIDVQELWNAEDSLGSYKKICMYSESGVWMPAYICKPHTEFNGKWIICMQGHTSGMHNSIAIDKKHERYLWRPHGERDFGIWCLRNGFGAVCLEQRGLGERKENKQKDMAKHPCQDIAMQALLVGRTLLGERLFDLGVVLKYLTETNSHCLSIGVMGHSLGGTLSIYAAALYQEISFCIASGCFSSFEDSIMNRYHCVDLYIPDIRQYFEFGDISGLIAPKPLLLIQAVNDKQFPMKGLRKEYQQTRRIYAATGMGQNLRIEIAQNGHKFYGELATIGKSYLGL